MKEINVTYLGHSGFLLETRTAYLLFDYYKGVIPELSGEKTLYVFSTHRHPDHYNPEILGFSERTGGVRFVLSDDIRKNRKLAREIQEKTREDEVIWVKPHRKPEIEGLGTVETLQSTDEGVAFLVSGAFGCIYHAGDLHWWNWEGEDPSWLRNMEVNYKREIERIAGRHFDLAFLVVDDRLEDHFAQGADWFLQHCPADIVFPMHFWEDPGVVERYPEELKRGAQWMRTDREREWRL
ncbi:MAG: MBL fold metallo-hydrolase [Lachnospiraceae bacterium]|nr:MBL fold metallo-hydrolase [Lachnospiraceae bacterium]